MTLAQYRRLVFSAGLFCVFTASVLYAQTLTSATMVSTIRDSTGAAVYAGQSFCLVSVSFSAHTEMRRSACASDKSKEGSH